MLGSMARFEGVHCTMEITRPAAGLVVVTISGSDIGEFGDAPFQELEADLASAQPLEMFVDGRHTRGPSVDVSNDWARWFRRRRSSLGRVTMLTGSRFLQITADFVRRFADLDDIMRITTDPTAFDAELADAIRSRS
jgi:hypothetical protein